jgi:hypothetical protein
MTGGAIDAVTGGFVMSGTAAGGFGRVVVAADVVTGVVVVNALAGALAVAIVAGGGEAVPVDDVEVDGSESVIAGLLSFGGVRRTTTTGSGALRLCHQSQAG